MAPWQSIKLSLSWSLATVAEASQRSFPRSEAASGDSSLGQGALGESVHVADPPRLPEGNQVRNHYLKECAFDFTLLSLKADQDLAGRVGRSWSFFGRSGRYGYYSLAGHTHL